jgi:hypothetical protein
VVCRAVKLLAESFYRLKEHNYNLRSLLFFSLHSGYSVVDYAKRKGVNSLNFYWQLIQKLHERLFQRILNHDSRAPSRITGFSPSYKTSCPRLPKYVIN